VYQQIVIVQLTVTCVCRARLPDGGGHEGGRETEETASSSPHSRLLRPVEIHVPPGPQLLPGPQRVGTRLTGHQWGAGRTGVTEEEREAIPGQGLT